MNGSFFRQGVKLITPQKIYSAPYSYGALNLRGGNCLNCQDTSYPYAFVRMNIAINAFRHVISRNLADPHTNTDGWFHGRFCAIPLLEIIGRGVFYLNQLRGGLPLFIGGEVVRVTTFLYGAIRAR